MDTETPADAKPVVLNKNTAPAQKPGIPKLVLPSTKLQRKQTREEKANGRKPRGYAQLDVGDFAARFGLFQRQRRKGLSRQQARAQAEKRERERILRGFFPQKGTKVGRADASPADRARGRMYLTLENGQVINPSKFLQRADANPVLVEKVVAFIAANSPEVANAS